MEHTIKIVICTERGLLEKYSLLLCRSLREFGGDMSQTEIYSIAPRKGYYPSKKTIFELEKLGVKHLNVNLNTKYKDDYFVNKFIAAKHIETQFPNDIIVFLDSDQIILNEPKAFYLNNDTDVMVRVVDRKNIGVSSEKDTEWNYWYSLYQLLGIDYRSLQKVETSSGEMILPYFQGGMIVSRAKNKLFAQVEKNYDLVRKQKIAPKEGNFFVEQSTYSATILQQNLPFKLVPNTFNYPLSLHDSILDKLKVNDFDTLHTAHYHDLLIHHPYPNYFKAFLENSEKGQWLNTQINELGISPPSYLGSMYEKLKRKLRKKFF